MEDSGQKKLEYNQNLVNVAKKCESLEKEHPRFREEKEWILRIITTNLTELDETIQDESLRERLEDIRKQTIELEGITVYSFYR